MAEKGEDAFLKEVGPCAGIQAPAGFHLALPDSGPCQVSE